MSKPEVFTFCVQVFEDHFRSKMTDDIAFSVSALDSMEPEEMLLESECVGSLTALVLAAEARFAFAGVV